MNSEIGRRGDAELAGFALFSINGYAPLGPPANNPQFSDSQTRQLTNDLLWTRGKHTVKMGGNLMFIQSPHLQAFQSNGTFTFNCNFTRQSSNNTFGNSYAEFFRRDSVQLAVVNRGAGQPAAAVHGVYIQDDVKWTNKLTINLGLRYEYVGPWFEKYNRYSNYDIDENRTRPQLRLAKDGNIADRSTLRPDYTNFAPRIGLAYRLDTRTVIRSGYGIYYGGVDHIGDRYLHASAPFFFQSGFNTDSITPTLLLRDGFPAGATSSGVSNLQTISQKTGRIARRIRSNGTLPYSANWAPTSHWSWAMRAQRETGCCSDMTRMHRTRARGTSTRDGR